MEQLYDFLESNDVDREEYAKRMPMISYNLSLWLGLKKDYMKSLAVAEKGIECSLKYGKYSDLANLYIIKVFHCSA